MDALDALIVAMLAAIPVGVALILWNVPTYRRPTRLAWLSVFIVWSVGMAAFLIVVRPR